jgi:hypothetical protein
MENYTSEGSSKTPLIYFDLMAGTLDIKGRSVPENPYEFYVPLLNAIDEYTLSSQPCTTVNVHLEYFNTTSSKCLLDVFKKFESIHKDGNTVTVNWKYENEDYDMLEAGQDYKEMIDLPFQMMEVNEK